MAHGFDLNSCIILLVCKIIGTDAPITPTILGDVPTAGRPSNWEEQRRPSFAGQIDFVVFFSSK